MSFRSESIDIARAAGGSFKTVKNRVLSIKKLARFLQRQNIQIRHLRHLKLKHLLAWIQSELASGVADRTCQNMLADVRVCLRKDKRGLNPDAIMTKDFDVAGASRKGTRAAISEDDYLDRLARVRDVGVKGALAVAWWLGLRRREAIMARLDTLERWERELQRDVRISVVFGTKGGRPRKTKVIDIQYSLVAVQAAIRVAETRGGRLIDAPNLKSAIYCFENQVRRAGFVGKQSPHSLRYAWAQKSMLRYKEEGLSYREALAATAVDLGHGEGRGAWVRNVYNLGGISW